MGCRAPALGDVPFRQEETGNEKAGQDGGSFTGPSCIFATGRQPLTSTPSPAVHHQAFQLPYPVSSRVCLDLQGHRSSPDVSLPQVTTSRMNSPGRPSACSQPRLGLCGQEGGGRPVSGRTHGAIPLRPTCREGLARFSSADREARAGVSRRHLASRRHPRASALRPHPTPKEKEKRVVRCPRHGRGGRRALGQRPRGSFPSRVPTACDPGAEAWHPFVSKLEPRSLFMG